MKYTDVDMQDVQSQSTLKVQSSDNGTSDRVARRSRPSDSANNNFSAKAAPEVIDLDGEDSPKENEEVSLPVNGVTTVKKVSWSKNVNLNAVDKKPSECSVESTSAECPSSERGSITSKELTAPAEADEALSNQAVEGERKRPNLTGTDEGDPKRPKIDCGAKVSSAKSAPKESDGKESPKPSAKESSEVSVVDLVEDDEEPEKVSKSKEQERSTANDGRVKVGGQVSVDSNHIAVEPSESDSPVPHFEKKVPSSVALASGAASQGTVCVQSPSSVKSPNVPPEEKRTSLSSIISSGKNGLITQMQSIEVKKVKLCPELEKQATAMSALSMTPAVAMPKPATGASKAQISVSITASTPETTEMPLLASSKALESANDAVKEGEAVLGAELEKKKGLNPVHSETRKMVKKLTRSELESFFLELACELLISKSDAGKYRQMYDEMKESCDNKSNKIAQLSKQLVDLSAVVHRAINENKDKRDTVPMKITRSVGLQLEQNQIFSAMKNKSREERGFIPSPATTSSSSNSSVSASDRIQSGKYVRSSSFPVSRTTPPSTPNGLIGGKDTSSSAPAPVKSPQRQLKALHPRTPQFPAQSALQSSTNISSAIPSSSPTSAPSTPDSATKRPGFIDIADERIINSGAQIGIRRHRASTVIVGTTSGSSVNSSTALTTLSSKIVTPLKLVPSHYQHTATIPSGNYSQSPGNTRVVTTAQIPVASGTPISSHNLTYLLPATNSMGPQRQLVLTSTAQAQQIRGRTPVTAMQTVLMRPNTTIVQVPTGSITATTPTLLRAVQPSAAQQLLAAAKTSPQPQAPRIVGMTNRPQLSSTKVSIKHPAPLPAQPQPTVVNANLKPIPRRPVLKLSKVQNGIVLSWNMTTTTPHEEIASYQLYAYQEGSNAPPSPLLWKKVGDVKALPLPMACTLTQFADGHTYHFAVRAVDVHGRVGEFSVPGTIELFS